jgi:hypothetical protein
LSQDFILFLVFPTNLNRTCTECRR